MTLFAVMCAGIFPLFHTGRPWRAYWLFPVPNTDLSMWQNFRSPLIWDVFAVSTYFTVSLLFWFTGLVPDLATLRDRAVSRVKQVVFGILSLGWRGSARHWRTYEAAYLILAGLSTPLVLSVHTIVSFDFATSVIPGWHTTIFPPYFVAGAIFSGFACVMTLLIIARWTLNLENLITMKHLENMNKIILVTGSFVGYAYACEFFIAWYSGNIYERFTRSSIAHSGLTAWAAWTDVSLVQRDYRRNCSGSRKCARSDSGDVRPLHHHQHRDVVRAIRHHRHQPASRFSAELVGLFPPDLGG